MLEIPPRLSRASTALLPVLATKPDSINVASLLMAKFGVSMKIMTMETKMFKKRVGIAGSFRHAQTNIRMIGKAAHHETLKFLVSTADALAMAAMEVPSLVKPRKAKIISERTNAGIVVHIIFLMWAKRSEPATAEAKLVESESGDILSPKTAPEMIAPAVNAGLTPNVAPIPKRARPTVETVVKPLPMAKPTSEQTMKTDGTKNLALIKWKPSTISEGIIPALIQTAIKLPMSRKMKIGTMAVEIPSVMPSVISFHETLRKASQPINKPMTVKTGTWGDRPKPITPTPKMTNIIIKIAIDS